jgi:lipoprotein-anchoring transpeptidase ErfK/SrfK
MSALKVIVDSSKQSLCVIRREESIFKAPVSTSQFGLGFEPRSLKTPTGTFQVSEKIGHDVPIGTIFKGRVPVTEPNWLGAPDLITSRILWLDGLDMENANTKERYIYIHGTNQEELIGQPASQGCIRMRNIDVVRLFDLVSVGTSIEIIG